MAGRPRLTPEERELSKERRRAWDRERHRKNKAKRNLARRIAHAKNPERLRKIERDKYAANPVKKKLIDVKSKYGETAVKHFLEVHNCQSCEDKVSGRTKHLDHDHSKPKTSAFRGVLCGNCNVALGYLKNDAKRITALLCYLQRSQQEN